MKTKIILSLFSFFLLTVISLSTAKEAYATCSTPSVNVEIKQSGPNIRVNNYDPAVTDSVYTSFFNTTGCKNTPYYWAELWYWDDSSTRTNKWKKQESVGWQTANNTNFSLDSGIRQYEIDVWVCDGLSINSDNECVSADPISGKGWSDFYQMDKTSSSANVTSTSARLSWSLRMNYYNTFFCLTNDPCTPSGFPFYLLMGTDPDILSNRNIASSETKINGFLKDVDNTNARITAYIDNYPIENLTPTTQYYWRIRGDNTLTTDSYFAGGRFTTPPSPPTVTTLDVSNLAPDNVTLNARVNPNGGSTTGWFRYSTGSSFICDDISGTRYPATGGIDLGSGKTDVNFSQTIPLSQQGAYSFCAIAENSGGKTLGQKRSFANSNRVFITSRWIKGNMFEGGGGLDGADFFCRSKATSARLGGTWKAWLSDSQTSAAERLAHFDSPYTLVDGAVIANNWADLIDGNLAQKINKTELNIASDGIVTWSNTTPNGSIDSTTDTCSNWTSTSGNGNTGHNGFTDLQWTKWGSGSCGDYAPLYCFEQSLLNKADFRTSDVRLNAGQLVAGNHISLKGTVWNIGSIAAIGNIKNRFDIDTNSTSFSSADVTLTPYTTFDELAPGATHSLTSASWNNAPAGTHTIRLCADQPDPVIDELDENNNCTTSSLTVTAPPSPTPTPKAAPSPIPTISTTDITKHPPVDDKICSSLDQTCIPFTTGNDHIYQILGNLDISTKQTGNQSGVVFVDGNLNITGDYTFGTALTGTVFIVKGNINIAPSVKIVEAVLIAEGKIHTAAEPDSSCLQNNVTEKSAGVAIEPLTINGSLISLNPANPAIFCRKLADNSVPAEVINHQPKYLVILRDLLSDTYQKWSEIP